MFVSVERSQGGLSLEDGEIEIIQNRRAIGNDNKGIEESLNDMANNEGVHTHNRYFVGLMPDSSSYSQRKVQVRTMDRPIVLKSKDISQLKVNQKTH